MLTQSLLPILQAYAREKEPIVSYQRTLTLLDALEGRPAGVWFFTSMDPRHLSCLKSRAPDQYIGLVVVDPSSATQKIPGAIGEILRARQPQQFTITDAMIEGISRAIPPPTRRARRAFRPRGR